MRRVAIAAGVGVIAGLLVAIVYFGAPFAGFRIDVSVLVALAAILAFASSIAAFTLSALDNTPAVATGGRGSTRLDQDPVKHFVDLFRDPGTIQILAVPGMPVNVLAMRLGRLLTDPEAQGGKRILLKIKKAKKGGDIFNPVHLKELFVMLKPFESNAHILLANEYDEFLGYIPGAKAMKEFTGANAETKIRENIIDILAKPSDSSRLRALDGMGADDFVSDKATIHEAAKIASSDLDTSGKPVLHGVVICAGKRNRKPIGVIGKGDIVQLITWGA